MEKNNTITNTDADILISDEIYQYFENFVEEIVNGQIYNSSLGKQIRNTHKINAYRNFIDKYHNMRVSTKTHCLGNYANMFDSVITLTQFYGKPEYEKIKKDNTYNIELLIPFFSENYELFLELKYMMSTPPTTTAPYP